jgi:hypothetical protein
VDEIECNESRENPEKLIPEIEMLKEISIPEPKMYNVEIEKNTETESHVNESEHNIFIIDFNDPSSWPPITYKIRSLLINHGPEQGKNSNFYFSENDTDKRRFTANWFTKIISNGEKVEHSLLIYSNKTKSVYCFPCMLFANKTMTSSAITIRNMDLIIGKS